MYKDIKKRRISQNKSFRKRQSFSRLKCIELLGNKCKNCGNNDIRILCIDHINGGGNKERLKFGGSYFMKILKEIEENNDIKYQLLCCNCNQIKKIENLEK